MPKLILCRGIQGSGKTAWARQWVLEDPEHRVRFSNDDIRNMLGKYWVTSREGLVRALRDTCVHRAMDEGFKDKLFCKNWIFIDDSYYLGRAKAGISVALRKIRPDASLYETYVIYDGSMGRADKVKSMYRYGK